MSLNLMLIFADKKDRWVNRVNLVQTPTEVTKLCLKTKEGKERSFVECKEAYLSWVEEVFKDMGDLDIEDEQRKLINDAMGKWGDDYEPRFIGI